MGEPTVNLTPYDHARGLLRSYVSMQYPSYDWAPHHLLVCAALERVARGECKRLMIFLPPRHGKALDVSTPIPTPTGWTTMGDIRPGDKVFDDQGRPCNVVAVSPVWRDRQFFQILTDDGDSVLADENHEWMVRLCRKHPVFKLKTSAQLAARNSSRSAMVERQGALDLPEADLLIPPYVLGAWLGDGTSLDGCITQGDDDFPVLQAFVESEGYRTTRRKSGTGLLGVYGLKAQLRVLGLLGNKHIPTAYLRASASQRLALLQGLVDTDGHVAPDGQVEVCGVDKRLAEQVRELVCSLGRKVSIVISRATIGGRDCGEKYRVMFYMADCARIPRKAVRCRDAVKTPNRYLTVTPTTGRGDTVCIEVDSPSHLFLCGRTMLPTHNSMLASEYFPAWYLGRYPDRSVIASSYSQELAEDFGRKVRSQVTDWVWGRVFPQASVMQGSASSARIDTNQGGHYYAVGVGGAVTGRGAHLLLIDDPVKGREDADSETMRRRQKDWFRSVAYTRLMPGGAIVMVLTRWHEDDLAGWCLSEHGDEGWEVLSLPAVAEPGDILGREPGEPLWPERYPLDVLERIKSVQGQRDWGALYQQRPAPDEGAYFRREWVRTYEEPPKGLRMFGASDYAVSADGGDYTVHVVAGVNDADDVYLVDMWREQSDALVWVESWLSMLRIWAPQAWADEAGVISKTVAPTLAKRLQEERLYRTLRKPYPSTTDKASRARGLQARMQAGKVFFPRHQDKPWVMELVGEMLTFPAGKHDDQVDALSLLCRMLDDIAPRRADNIHRQARALH